MLSKANLGEGPHGSEAQALAAWTRSIALTHVERGAASAAAPPNASIEAEARLEYYNAATLELQVASDFLNQVLEKINLKRHPTTFQV